MNGALECTHPPCRRKIYHPSGRCQNHRSARSERDRLLAGTGSPAGTTASPPPVPAPAVTAPEEWVVLPPDDHEEESISVVQRRLPDGGTHTKFREYDEVVREEWRNSAGGLHRLDGPARILYADSGRTLDVESYYANNVRHRPLEEGPAVVRYDPSGGVANGTFYVNGALPDALDHQQSTHYAADGSVSEELWFFGSGTYPSRAAVAEALFDHPSERALEEVRKSRFGALLDEGFEHGRIVEVLAQGVNSLGGVREVLGGAPVEWVRSYEESRVAR